MTTTPNDPNSGDYEVILALSGHPDLDNERRVRLAKHALSHLLKGAMTIDDIADATDLERSRVVAVLDKIDGRITKGAVLNGVLRDDGLLDDQNSPTEVNQT